MNVSHGRGLSMQFQLDLLRESLGKCSFALLTVWWSCDANIFSLLRYRLWSVLCENWGLIHLTRSSRHHIYPTSPSNPIANQTTRPSSITIAKRLHRRSSRQTCPRNVVSMPSPQSNTLPHRHLAIFKITTITSPSLRSRPLFRPLKAWEADQVGSTMRKFNVVWHRPVASPRIKSRNGWTTCWTAWSFLYVPTLRTRTI